MKYFLLEWKRLLKMLVFLLLIAALLMSISLVVFQQFSYFLKSDRDSKITISVVGNTDSRLFTAGIMALKTMDSSRFSMDLQLTDEETAKKQLRNGEISAYVVIPEGFTKAARQGEILPICYYTTTSTVDVSALLRDEMTKVIEVVLKESQKGVFGGEQMLAENGYQSIALTKANFLNIQYIDFIIERARMYKTDITGVSYGLDLMQHLFIGITILLLCVLVIPLVCLLVRRDNSMLRFLRAAGCGSVRTALSEFFAMVLVFLPALGILAGCVTVLNRFLPLAQMADVGFDLSIFARSLIPVSVLVCAFAFAVTELSGNMLSAVTGFFFFSMGLCYISGCMYPLYALPPILQQIAAFTPTGAARAFVSLSVTQLDAGLPAAVIAGWTVLFLVLAAVAREHKLSKGEA